MNFILVCQTVIANLKISRYKSRNETVYFFKLYRLFSDSQNIVPDGFEKPTIYRIEAKSIRVSWQPPKTPNGDVMNYTIIA